MIDDFIPVTIISCIRIQLNIDIYLKEVQNLFSVLYFFSLSMKLSKPIKNDTAATAMPFLSFFNFKTDRH